MAITWTPRINVLCNAETVGFLECSPVATEVLPHIGESVSFVHGWNTGVLALKSGPTYVSKVIAVGHFINPNAATDITVTIEMQSGASIATIEAEGKRIGSGFMLNSL